VARSLRNSASTERRDARLSLNESAHLCVCVMTCAGLSAEVSSVLLSLVRMSSLSQINELIHKYLANI